MLDDDGMDYSTCVHAVRRACVPVATSHRIRQ
jgi:hypothetical protein